MSLDNVKGKLNTIFFADDTTDRRELRGFEKKVYEFHTL